MLRNLLTLLLFALVVPLAGSTGRTEVPPHVLVRTIDLNNIHKSAPESALAGRVTRLTDALRSRFATACGYEVVPVDPATEAPAQARAADPQAHVVRVAIPWW